MFVFWELVGICSYLLIGFYVERKSASNAANKAFIVNRVGDFGFIIGLMIIWTSFGTFRFFDLEIDTKPVPGQDAETKSVPGLFSMISRVDAKEGYTGGDEHHGAEHHGPQRLDVDKTQSVVYLHDVEGKRIEDDITGEKSTIPYWLLIVAGIAGGLLLPLQVGLFATDIFQSRQFWSIGKGHLLAVRAPLCTDGLPFVC